MPFGDYEDFDACVRDNQDKNDPEAYCAAIKREVEGEGALSEDELEAYKRLSSRVQLPTTRLLAASSPQTVERIEEGDKVRITNVQLLAAGEWTDALSGEKVFYAPDAIKRSADNWVDPQTGEPVEKAQLNHFHDPESPSENVGHVPVDSVYEHNGALYGDLVFHMRNERSREMEEMMTLALETEGEEGLGGVSVEIPKDEVEWDAERGLKRSVEMWFGGVGLVQYPASMDVKFSTQFSERAVALASSGPYDDVHLMTRTTKSDADGEGDMGEEDPFKRLAELQERTRELARDLQNVTDMTLNAIGQYLGQEGTSDEDDLSAFQQWVADNLEEQLVAAVEETVQAYLDATETSLDEATVGGYVEWAEGATTSEEEAEGGEPTEAELQDGEGGGDVPAEAVEQVATVLEDVVDMVADATQTLQEEVGAVGEQTETAVEEVSELKARLADLEESADSRALTEGLGQQSEDGNEYDEDETPPPEEGGPQVDTSQPGVIGQG